MREPAIEAHIWIAQQVQAELQESDRPAALLTLWTGCVVLGWVLADGVTSAVEALSHGVSA